MTHAPKWRALIAFDAGALSDQGETRLARHVEDCDVCQRALAEIQAFDTVARETRETPPVVDWSRMEVALRREARTQSQAIRAARRRRSWKVPAAVALAAAAAVAVFMIWRTGPEPELPLAEEVVPEPIAPAPIPSAADQVEGTIVALAGTPAAVRGDDRRPLELGDALMEGDRIEVAARQALHATLGAGAAIALEGAAELTAQVLRADDMEMHLHEGRLSSAVRHGEPFTVVAAPYAIHARGTRFRVERTEGVVTVTLEEGRVSVTREGETVAELEAPARWSSSPETRLASEDPVAVETPGSEPGSLVLELPASERFVSWQIDDAVLPAGAAGALLLAAGEHTLLGFDVEGDAYETRLALMDEGLTLDERTLTAIHDEPVVGFLSPEQIQDTVRPTVRLLRSCYERDLRRTDPNLGGSYTLRVRVARNGSVRRVTVATEDELPHTLRNCLVRHASEWQFPAPEGGPVTFDLPLNLRTR